jgi:beta-galactosidase/beta-glucuronidase
MNSYKIQTWIIAVMFFILSVPYASGVANPTEKQIVYLSGTDNEHTVKWDFYCTGGRKSGYWTNVEVPSCWEQQGFGIYNYGRDSYTYGKKFKFADEKGLYKHTFNVPVEWSTREVYLVFEGSMTDTEVKINGKSAGPIHQGAFYRFKYNISDKLIYGKLNILEVTVSKWSADKSVNEAERTADYWIFGGIFRPVYLEVLPKEHIDRVAINATATGSFALDVFPRNLKTGSDITVDILDNRGQIVAKGAVKANPGDSILTIKCTVSNPQTWTSETPNLYKVRYTLKSNNKAVFQGSTKFGFRTIEIRHGDGIYINGTKVKMKGINRHVWWPETGRCVNRKIDLMDVQLIKGMNMNAVRCSHYPPDQSFLDICDSLGLFVLDELAGWQDAYSTTAGAPLVKEMVIRDVNHPSIIFWDNGNEGGTNKELDDDFLSYDPSKRPVIHPHHRPGNDFNGIDCNHYENYASTTKILSDSLIYMPTEFLHCEDDGGGGAGLQDFWELMWESPKSGGGFLWAYLDEGVVRTDLHNIIDVNGVNAEDGVVGPHREKEGSYNAIKEIFSPVKISELNINDQEALSLNFENRYHFTNLNKLVFKCKLIKYRQPNEALSGYTITDSAAFHIECEPGKKVHSTLGDVNLKNKQSDAILIEAYDPTGNEIMKWTSKTKENTDIVKSIINNEVADTAQFAETDTTFTLKANKIAVSFNKKDGKLAFVRTETPNQLNFRNGPVMVNGNVTQMGYKHYRDSDGYALEFRYTGDLEFVRWKMHPNGWLSLEYAYTLKGNYPFTGISFDYPEAHVLSAKWLGNGPYRVWKNRPQGVTLNVWENAYNNTQTGSAPWIYPEFKGYFSNISWMELNTVEGKFYVVSKEDNLFVRLFDFYAMPGIKPYPELPSGNISFLDCIPPIGTKMAVRIDGNASVNGPMGKMNEIDTTFNHTLYFYFGLLQ